MKNPKIVSIEDDAQGRYLLLADGKTEARYSPDNAGLNVALVDAIKLAFSLKYDFGNDNVKIVFKGAAAQLFSPKSLGAEEMSMGIEELVPVS